MPITQQQQPGKHSFWQFANKTCAYDIRRRLAKKLWQKSVKHTYRIIHSPFTDTHSWYKKLTTNFRPTNAEAKYRTWILFIAKNRDRRSPCPIIPSANIMLSFSVKLPILLEQESHTLTVNGQVLHLYHCKAFESSFPQTRKKPIFTGWQTRKQPQQSALLDKEI